MSGTLKVTTLQDGASSTANLTFDSSANATVGGTLAMASSFKRNRLINGNMVVDQRNAGASVTAGVGFLFITDRWANVGSVASKFTSQQNAGAVTPPVGYINYLGSTSSATTTLAAGDYYLINQKIEGLNVADLSWGAASAATVTLSFWVRSSLTGTFGGSLRNSAQNRAYPFSYTISVANTWEQKAITIAGDTTGTWLTTNGTGIDISFSLGTGTTYSNTAGAWAAGNYFSATGAVSVVGTSGATFYITGVQLEVGTKATSYEMQIYSDQLAQCQRYYTVGTAYYDGYGIAPSGATGSLNLFPVPMRTAPTLAFGTFTNLALLQVGATRSPIYSYMFMRYANFNVTGSGAAYEQWTASAEL